MTRPRTAGILIAVVAIVFGAGAWRVATDTPTVVPVAGKSTGDWKAAMLGCFPNFDRGDYGADPEMECLIGVMNQAIDRGEIDLLQEVLGEQMLRDQNFNSQCHTAGHKAGQYAYATGTPIDELLAQVSNPACQYGIGHGVIDGMADQNPDPAEFRKVMEVCERHRTGDLAPMEAFTFCADGTGHAAYWSTHDPVAAAQICALHLSDDGKRECMGGVMMEMYEPAGFLDRAEPDYRLADAVTDLPEVCRTVDEQVGDASVTLGCWRGGGYVLTRPAWWITEQTTIEEMTQAWTTALGNCSVFGDPGMSACRSMAFYQIPPQIREQPDLHRELCSRFEGNELQMCMDIVVVT